MNVPERRLAAILVADVVGFSRLLGEDEAGTLQRMAAARRTIIDPCIETHRGRIFKEVGDGLLAEFPSAVLALCAAALMQERLGAGNAGRPAAERLVFRIGLHQGEVVVQGLDLVGDGVNVAARLERLASAGGICVSHRIREDAMGKLHLGFADLGERALKNIAYPVRVYNVLPQSSDTAVDTGHRIMLPTIPGLPPSIVLGPSQRLTIGRSAPPSDYALPDKEISRAHCRFELAAGEMLLIDLDSTNGTFVDGEPIAGPARLRHGARVRVGGTTLSYVCDEEADAERTIVRPRSRIHAKSSWGSTAKSG